MLFVRILRAGKDVFFELIYELFKAKFLQL